MMPPGAVKSAASDRSIGQEIPRTLCCAHIHRVENEDGCADEKVGAGQLGRRQRNSHLWRWKQIKSGFVVSGLWMTQVIPVWGLVEPLCLAASLLLLDRIEILSVYCRIPGCYRLPPPGF